MALHLVTGYRGSAHVTSADVGAFNAAFMGAGDYVCKTGKQFEAHALTNNTIRILDGDLLMQGRYVNLAVDTYEDVTIENGAQGMKRNDFIVCRYTKDVSSGTENAIFAVIKGTDTEGTASDPFVTTGNILSGALLHEMPLYRVKIEGISITKIEPLFAVRSSVSELTAKDVGARPSNWMPTAGDVGAPTLEEFNKQKSDFTEHTHTAEDVGAMRSETLLLNGTSLAEYLDACENSSKNGVSNGVVAYSNAPDAPSDISSGFLLYSRNYSLTTGYHLVAFFNGTMRLGYYYRGSNIVWVKGLSVAGSYTGNGSATTRTIDTGVLSNELIITSGDAMLHVTPSGAIAKNGTNVYAFSMNSINFFNGILTISSNDLLFNGNNYTYYYSAK